MVAAQVPVEQTYRIDQFVGLDLRDDPANIPDNTLTELINFDVTPSGELVKRSAFNLVTETDANQQGMQANNVLVLVGHFHTKNYSHILACNGVDFYWSDDGAATWHIEYINEVGGAHAGNIQTGVQYHDLFYLCCPNDVMRYWDGTSLRDIAGSPAASMCTVYKDRMFTVDYVGDPILGNTDSWVMYSKQVGDPAVESEPFPFSSGYWGESESSGHIDVQGGDGDICTTLFVLQDQFFIWKTHSMWRLSIPSPDVTTWVLRVISRSVGCVSQFTVREVEGSIYFLGEFALYKTDGVTFEDVSQAIYPSAFQGHFPSGGVATLQLTNRDSAGLWNGKYLLHLVTDPAGIVASRDRLWILDVKTGGWSRYEIAPFWAGGFHPHNMIEVDNPYITGYKHRGLYIGDARIPGLNIWRWGSPVDVQNYADTATSIDSSTGITRVGPQTFVATFTTKDYVFEDPVSVKRAKWGMVEANIKTANSTTWSQFTFTGSPIAQTTTGPVPITSGYRDYRSIRGPGMFRAWQFGLVNQNDVEKVIVYSVSLRHVKINQRLAGA